MKTEERAVEAGCYRFDGCTSVRIKNKKLCEMVGR